MSSKTTETGLLLLSGDDDTALRVGNNSPKVATVKSGELVPGNLPPAKKSLSGTVSSEKGGERRRTELKPRQGPDAV